ncbi:MAG: hypothetical protein QM811_17910 [Pirellulales bacterium]
MRRVSAFLPRFSLKLLLGVVALCALATVIFNDIERHRYRNAQLAALNAPVAWPTSPFSRPHPSVEPYLAHPFPDDDPGWRRRLYGDEYSPPIRKLEHVPIPPIAWNDEALDNILLGENSTAHECFDASAFPELEELDVVEYQNRVRPETLGATRNLTVFRYIDVLRDARNPITQLLAPPRVDRQLPRFLVAFPTLPRLERFEVGGRRLFLEGRYLSTLLEKAPHLEHLTLNLRDLAPTRRTRCGTVRICATSI